MEEAPKPGWKDKAKKAGKWGGGGTLAGLLVLAATEVVQLGQEFVKNIGSQTVAVETATKKLERSIRLVQRKQDQQIAEIRSEENRKDDRVFAELQGQRADIRDLRNLLLNTRRENNLPFGHTVSVPVPLITPEGDDS